MAIGRPGSGLEDRPARARETFRMIPDRMWLHPKVKDFDLRLWCGLLFLARDRDYCTPTDLDLASKIKASQQTIRRSLQRLEAAKFVEREMDGRTRIIRLRPEGDGEPVAEYALRLATG